MWTEIAECINGDQTGDTCRIAYRSRTCRDLFNATFASNLKVLPTHKKAAAGLSVDVGQYNDNEHVSVDGENFWNAEVRIHYSIYALTHLIKNLLHCC